MKAVKSLFLCVALLGPGLAVTSGADLPEISAEYQAYMLQHHYAAAPLLESHYGLNAQMLEAKVNGHTVHLHLDSGAPFTCISDECARDLDLDVHDSGQRVGGTGGVFKQDRGIATIQSFTIAGYPITRPSTIVVLPKGASLLRDADGIFGLDLMKLNSVVFPIGGHGILFKPGPAPVASIQTFMNKLGYNSVPLDLSGPKVFAMGRLNGQPFRAVIDTGDEFTTFTHDFVKSVLGHELTYEGKPFHGLDGRLTPIYSFRPSTLALGDCALQPGLTAAASKFNVNADALFGFDYLGQNNAVFDCGDGILWIKTPPPINYGGGNRNLIFSTEEAIHLALINEPREVPGTFRLAVKNATPRMGGVYLDSMPSSWSDRNLRVVVFQSATREFTAKYGESPDKLLKGKTVLIHGSVIRCRSSEYGFTRKQTGIQVTSADQIEIGPTH